jgi:hypothetical protein
MKILGIFKYIWPQITYISVIIIIILVLPVKTIFTITLAIVAISLWYKLLNEVHTLKKPSPLDWLKTTLKTALTSFILLVLYKGAGFLGYAALLALIIIIVAWKIKQGWKIYDAVTKWGADRIRGRTNEEFDFEKVIKDEKETRRESKRTNGEDVVNKGRQGSYETHKEESITDDSVLKDSKEALPQVQVVDIPPSPTREESLQEPLVCNLQKNVGVRRKSFKRKVKL